MWAVMSRNYSSFPQNYERILMAKKVKKFKSLIEKAGDFNKDQTKIKGEILKLNQYIADTIDAYKRLDAYECLVDKLNQRIDRIVDMHERCKSLRGL